MADTVTFTGFEELVKVFTGVQGIFRPLALKAAYDTLEAVKKLMEVYPPQPDRMRSGHYNNYVRGVGHVPKSEIIRTNGDVTLMNLAGIRQTSEHLGKRFEIEMNVTDDGAVGTLTNDASYSPFVIGESQVPWHAETGWLTGETAMDRVTGKIETVVDDLTETFIDRLMGG